MLLIDDTVAHLLPIDPQKPVCLAPLPKTAASRPSVPPCNVYRSKCSVSTPPLEITQMSTAFPLPPSVAKMRRPVDVTAVVTEIWS